VYFVVCFARRKPFETPHLRWHFANLAYGLPMKNVVDVSVELQFRVVGSVDG
jgi:hypothetical protein